MAAAGGFGVCNSLVGLRSKTSLYRYIRGHFPFELAGMTRFSIFPFKIGKDFLATKRFRWCWLGVGQFIVKRTMQITAAIALMGGSATLYALNGLSENRFKTIPLRNAFALRASVPVLDVTPPQAPTAPPKVVVTGVTDLGGASKVLLESTEPGKQVTRAILSEGETFGVVQILRIDVAAGRVDVRIRGIEKTLTFEPAKDLPPSASVQRRGSS